MKSAEMLNGMMPAAGTSSICPRISFSASGATRRRPKRTARARRADLAYLKATAAPDYYPMYLIHNFQFLGAAAGMEGRRAETIQALRQAREYMPDAMLLATPGFDWGAGFLYDGLVKFGMWEDMLKEAAPNPKLTGATIHYLQARATALAATGKVDEANAALAKAAALIAATPADATQGNNSAKSLYDIGQLEAQARLAIAQGNQREAIELLTRAVAAEDGIAYNEPSDIIFPCAASARGRAAGGKTAVEAKAVFREDLKRHPNNGWALRGLSLALADQHKAEATKSASDFRKAWSKADVQLTAAAF